MKQQLTLGQLIFLLSRCDSKAEVRYDFGPFHPCGLDSYRGYYEQLAVGYSEDSISAGALHALLVDARGKDFTGWKGGDYEMHDGTWMWMANRGHCYDTAIVGVIDHEYEVILETAYAA